MLEKIFFDLVAVALFIIILSKVIKKNDSNYVSILVFEAIGIFISFVEIKIHVNANTFFLCLRYIFSIILPVIIIFLEARGINFSEILSCACAKFYLTFNKEKTSKSILIKLVTKYPDSYMGHKYLAELYELEGGMRKAIDEYVKLVDIKKDDDKSYFKIADLLNDLGQKKEAIQMLNNLVKVKPDSYEGSILLGQLLCEDGQFKEAEKVYQDALKYNPNNYELYYNLGIVYTMLSEFQMAKEAYEMAAEINHLAYGANYNLGQIYLLIGDMEMAQKFFEQSLYDELEPMSYYHLAKIFVMRGDNSMAVNFLNKAIELRPALLQKANQDSIFENVRHMITVSVKMEDDLVNEKEDIENDEEVDCKKNILTIENDAREYLESTNVLIRDISDNTERQLIKERVDRIFEAKKIEDEKKIEQELDPKEREQRQK